MRGHLENVNESDRQQLRKSLPSRGEIQCTGPEMGRVQGREKGSVVGAT